MIEVMGIHGNGNTSLNGHTSTSVQPNVLPTGTVATNIALPTPEEIGALNVHQRIRFVTAEARSLPRSEWNREGAFAYAGHDQVIEMLRLLLAKYGVNIYQEALEYKREVSPGRTQYLTTVRYEYDVVNSDRPDDKFTRHNWGEAMDDWDKGLNKCSTIAEKVFLLRLFKLSTFDDPDAHSAEERRNRSGSHDGSEKARSDRAPHPPGKNECHACHELITKASRNNKVWQLSEIITISKKRFGKPLCVDCFLAAQAAKAGAATEANNGNGDQRESGNHTPAESKQQARDSNTSDAAQDAAK